MRTDGSDNQAFQVDARGLICPQPVLMLREALRAAAPGTRVELLASDPLARVDVHAYCARTGHRVVHEEARNGESRFVVQACG